MKAVVVGAVAIAGALLALDLVAGPWVSFAVRQSPPVRHGQRLVGSLEGPVKSTDEQAGIVRVASGFLGISSLPVIVTPETTITVDGKLGWLGDLRRGLLVRVAYEVLPDERLVASRVELIDHAPPPSAGVATDRPERIPREASLAPAQDSPAAGAAPAALPPEPAAAGSAAPEASMARSAAPGRTALSPPSPPRRAKRLPPSISARASVSLPAPDESAGPSRPTPAAEGAPAEDGRAAIDWLFREAPLGR